MLILLIGGPLKQARFGVVLPIEVFARCPLEQFGCLRPCSSKHRHASLAFRWRPLCSALARGSSPLGFLTVELSQVLEALWDAALAKSLWLPPTPPSSQLLHCNVVFPKGNMLTPGVNTLNYVIRSVLTYFFMQAAQP